MTRKLLTVDEFRTSAKGGTKPEGTVVRLAVADPVAADDSRKIRFVFSDGTVDRAGDCIDPNGWEIKAFLDNPVALWSHDSFSPPIGRASNVGPSGNALMGDIEFMDAEISAFADMIYRMVVAGFVKAVSVGFLPLQYSFVNSNDRPFGINFMKQELLEVSLCPVPCNPNALQEAKAQGIDTGPLREWASKVLDEGGHVLVPRNMLEETFRQAKTPRTVRQKYLAKSATPDWKVGASRDLPIDDADAWDGPGAAKRMLDAAGFDGDSPNASKAARGFLIHDSANPTLRGSYKLPFADIVGGTLKAIKGGISAAKGRLNQTDAPASVLAEAGAVIDEYEKKFGKSYSPATVKDTAGEDAGNIIEQIIELHQGHMTAAAGMLKSMQEEMDLLNEALSSYDAEETAEGKEIRAAPVTKAGRRISSANEALLNKAMDHHASATQCVKDVLASNAADNHDDDGGNDLEIVVPPKMVTEADKRAQRLAEARTLRASVKL